MIDKIETIRQVLVTAVSISLPGASTALQDLADINQGILTLKELEDDIIQAAIDEQEEEDIANGVISNASN